MCIFDVQCLTTYCFRLRKLLDGNTNGKWFTISCFNFKMIPFFQISILIGHNDLCSKSCITSFQALGLTRRVKVEPRDYERNIRKSLDLLAHYLPRTFVVLLAPADVTQVKSLVNKPFLCNITHKYECPGKPNLKYLIFLEIFHFHTITYVSIANPIEPNPR